MSNYFVNAAPMIQQYGTEDLSTTRLPREAEVVAQHIPKFYLYTQKGPEDPNLVTGAEAKLMYGDITFDERGPYHNHATAFANLAIANANSIMIERVKPTDANPNSKIELYLDVLPLFELNIYERNEDGSFAIGVDGNKIISETLEATDVNPIGYSCMWVLKSVPDTAHFGQLTISTLGLQEVTHTYEDEEGHTQTETVISKQYPILEMQASSFGAWSKNSGIRIWAPTVDDEFNIPRTMMDREKAYPYRLSVIRRVDVNSTPKAVPTMMGDQNTLFTWKPDVIDPSTDANLYLNDIFLDKYRNLSDPLFPKVYGDFGKIKVYQDNIDLLVTKFLDAERGLAADADYTSPSWTDFDTTDSADWTANWATQRHLFNFVSGVSSQNVPYHSFSLISNSNTVTLSASSNLYASGGSDGTMHTTIVDGDPVDLFAALVEAKMDEYLDPMSPLQENAVNVESIIYDSGFPLQTKMKLANIIALRKDTFVVLGVHEVNDDDSVMDASEENAAAVGLRQYLQSFPESEYFGTPVMRGMIVGRSGKLLNSRYKKRLPLTAEVLIKACRYMGAGDGSWKSTYSFDGAPNDIVDSMYDINITWVPASVRNVNWANGLIWVQAYDRRQFFFPAFKTVYPDDTSVLNSFFTAMAICQINKVTAAAWRQFSGIEGLTNAQLMQRTNDFISQRTAPSRFDNRYIIEPAAFMTDADIARGYSWTVPVKIYANNMKTVMTSYVQAYRMDAYAPVQ